MATLTIIDKTIKASKEVDSSAKKRFRMNIPRFVYINDRLLGVMSSREVTIQIPEGRYKVTIQSAIKFLQSSAIVNVYGITENHVEFSDREKIWDIVFWADLVLWIIKKIWFNSTAWGRIYEIISDTFFIVWLLRIWIIRKKYFKMDVFSKPIPRDSVYPAEESSNQQGQEKSLSSEGEV